MKISKKLKFPLKIQNDILQNNVVWDFFLELDVELKINMNSHDLQLLLKYLSYFTWKDPLENETLSNLYFKKNGG
jgi:hypothetical protein